MLDNRPPSCYPPGGHCASGSRLCAGRPPLPCGGFLVSSYRYPGRYSLYPLGVGDILPCWERPPEDGCLLLEWAFFIFQKNIIKSSTGKLPSRRDITNGSQCYVICYVY